MLENISRLLRKPALYEAGETMFWKDEYISKQLLKAHLDPLYDGATRKLEFIEKSIKWIPSIVSPHEYPLLLDLGCGPGVYAERLTLSGFKVTGIDFSERSINYAQKEASSKKLDINYLYQNYMELSYNNTFDFVTLIYCDYGALPTESRKPLMKNIYRALKPNGKFLLDVFSENKYNAFEEGQTWNITENNGFWSDKKYLEFNGRYKHQKNVSLEHCTIITNDDVQNHFLWTTYFSKESLINEAQEAGFKVVEIYDDVAGNAYTGKSETIAILFEK